MATLNGLFLEPKPHKINFIKENKKKLRQASSVASQNLKYSKLNIVKSFSAQHHGNRKHSSGSPVRHKTIKKSSGTGCKIGHREDIAVFIHDKEGNDSGDEGLIKEERTRRKTMYFKHQSVQTIDPKKFDQLFYDGVIKYPSAAVQQKLEEIKNQKSQRLDAHIKKDVLDKKRKSKAKLSAIILPNNQKSPSGTGDHVPKQLSPEKSTPKKISKCNKDAGDKAQVSAVDKSELNAADIIQKATESQASFPGMGFLTKRSNLSSDRSSNNNPPPSYKRGEVPKYLKEMQKKKLEEEKASELIDIECPPGHIPLPEEERKKTLHMLRSSYAESIRELNQLPVRSDTLRVRQKKCQLDQQLAKLEEGIKVFSKSKVYVKIE